jgi:predicted alpha/beta superfamily hydrolase
MKKTIILFFCLLSIINIYAQDILYPTASDTAIMMKSKYFSFERKVFISLPACYQVCNVLNYDVIYVFDTQDKPYFYLVNALTPFINMNYDNRFIVVGICSPSTPRYSRQNDFLPVPKTMAKDKFYRGHNGYSDSLCLFIKNELMPYVNSHYRTTGHTLAVGHSLGASFILESMINHELFSDYIAVSPNLAYDNDRVTEDLMKYDYSKISAKRYLFISNSSEEKTHGWENWKPAREKLYQFYQKKTLPVNLTYRQKSYPEYDHMSCFPYALRDGLMGYFQYRDSIDKYLSKNTYKVHIEVKIPNAADEVYITGNQKVLGDWNPGKIKMNHVSDTIRSIDVDLHYPALLKFTRGSWQTEGFIGNSTIGGNQRIESPDRHDYQFIIAGWSDR